MHVTVLCFARLGELVGRREWSCDVPAPATIADVWQSLVRTFPDASAMSASISCARNAEFAAMGARVEENDEIAFLPPVSGGTFGAR
jgi:molybdopterin converting factor small subunit